MLGQVALERSDVLLTFDQEAQCRPYLAWMVIVDVGVGVGDLTHDLGFADRTLERFELARLELDVDVFDQVRVGDDAQGAFMVEQVGEEACQQLGGQVGFGEGTLRG